MYLSDEGYKEARYVDGVLRLETLRVSNSRMKVQAAIEAQGAWWPGG